MWSTPIDIKKSERKRIAELKAKNKRREFWIVESEYGWDVKRYVTSVCRTEQEAKAFKTYLDIKNPYDKHEIFHMKEIKRKEAPERV